MNLGFFKVILGEFLIIFMAVLGGNLGSFTGGFEGEFVGWECLSGVVLMIAEN